MIQLHIAVFLFGLAGLFGKLLLIPATAIVLGRTAFGTATLGVILVATKRTDLLGRREIVRAIPSGILLAAHWVTFFQSIQVSSVAVGLLSFATFPVFVAFLDPILSRSKLAKSDIITALLVFAGLALVVPNYDFGDRAFQGALWGLASGVTFALLTIWNRSLVVKTDPIVLGLLQNFWAAVALTPFYTALLSLDQNELLLLLFLGVVCTAIAHWLFIHALRSVRAQVASVAASLEPVYGILLAAAVLGEVPSLRETGGGLLILAVVTVSSIRERSGA